jgi:hypothetical protein
VVVVVAEGWLLARDAPKRAGTAFERAFPAFCSGLEYSGCRCHPVKALELCREQSKNSV